MSLQQVERIQLSSMMPRFLIAGQEEEEKGKSKPVIRDEKAMISITRFMINAGLRTINELQKRHYKNFDANPGDGGCQARALELRRLIHLDMREECAQLKEQLNTVRDQLIKRSNDPSLQRKCPPMKFFETYVESITLSREMNYLVHCYVSTVLRTPYEIRPDGVVMTKSECSKLSMVEKNITILSSHARHKIVEINQQTLSLLSIEAMRSSAAQLRTLSPVQRERAVTMLSGEHVHLFTPDPRYEVKAFGCLFYQVQTVLMKLREEQAMVCLKSIVPQGQGKPFFLLFQSSEPGQELSLVSAQVAPLLQPQDDLVVFEAVIHQSKEVAAMTIMEHGFTQLMLMQAADEAPYQQGSTLEGDVTLAEAREEILEYRQRLQAIPKVLTLDHVYLNTVGHEKL